VRATASTLKVRGERKVVTSRLREGRRLSAGEGQITNRYRYQNSFITPASQR